MYNNVYQEYINNIIGITPRNQLDFENDAYINANTYGNFQSNMSNDLEKLYPDLYKLLYPMIQTACMKNTKPITEETLNEMVNDIYSNFNADDVTILNINLTNNVRSSSSNTSKIERSSTRNQAENRKGEESEERVSRAPNNHVLNDLIRILLIRELIGKPGNFPPNRPGFSPTRPPFRPRDIKSMDYNIYENPINMYPNRNEQYIF